MVIADIMVSKFAEVIGSEACVDIISNVAEVDGVMASVFGNTNVGRINDWLLDISNVDVKVSDYSNTGYEAGYNYT